MMIIYVISPLLQRTGIDQNVYVFPVNGSRTAAKNQLVEKMENCLQPFVTLLATFCDSANDLCFEILAHTHELIRQRRVFGVRDATCNCE